MVPRECFYPVREHAHVRLQLHILEAGPGLFRKSEIQTMYLQAPTTQNEAYLRKLFGKSE